MKFIVYLAIVYSITLIVTREEIFFNLRNFFNKEGKIYQFIYSILTCVVCFSTWLGLIMGVLLVLSGKGSYPEIFLGTNKVVGIILNMFFTSGIVYVTYKILKKIENL